MGKLQKRIETEYVTIKIGKDDPISKSNPGRKWMEVIHNNTVMWLAWRTDSILNFTIYIMLYPSSKLKGQNDVER